MENSSEAVTTTKTHSKNPIMASFLNRFLAQLIDGLMIAFVSYALMFFIAIHGGIFGFLIAESSNSSDLIAKTGTIGFSLIISYIVGIIILIALQVFYYTYMTSKYGQTLGKRLLKVKVVSSINLQNISWKRALLRELPGRWASGFAFYLGYFWYFMSGKRQAWHDSIADTYVVAVDEKGEIRHSGPAVYPSEPVKAFLLFGLFISGMILYFVFIFEMIAILGSETSTSVSKSQNYNYEYKNTNTQELKEEEIKSGQGGICGGNTGVKCRSGLYCSYKNSPRIGECAIIPQ